MEVLDFILDDSWVREYRPINNLCSGLLNHRVGRIAALIQLSVLAAEDPIVNVEIWHEEIEKVGAFLRCKATSTFEY